MHSYLFMFLKLPLAVSTNIIVPNSLRICMPTSLCLCPNLCMFIVLLCMCVQLFLYMFTLSVYVHSFCMFILLLRMYAQLSLCISNSPYVLSTSFCIANLLLCVCISILFLLYPQASLCMCVQPPSVCISNLLLCMSHSASMRLPNFPCVCIPKPLRVCMPNSLCMSNSLCSYMPKPPDVLPFSF